MEWQTTIKRVVIENHGGEVYTTSPSKQVNSIRKYIKQKLWKWQMKLIEDHEFDLFKQNTFLSICLFGSTNSHSPKHDTSRQK